MIFATDDRQYVARIWSICAIGERVIKPASAHPDEWSDYGWGEILMKIFGRCGLGVVAATIAAAPLVTHADALAGTGAKTAASAVIEEVVVTAQKREQYLQSVPATVSAVTSATLADAGVTNMQDLAVLVPSLQVIENVGPISQSYHVRGVGSEASLATFEPDVALFIDGVYMPRSGLGVDDLADLARVEVLEGPQSTLYGKSATAGVINIVTKAPSQRFEANIEGSVSGLDGGRDASARRFAGSISGPVSGRLRGRLSLVSYTQDANFKNLEPGAPDANNMNRYSVRAQLVSDLWSDATLSISAIRTQVYDTHSGNPDLQYYTFAPPNRAAALDFGPLGSLFHITPCPDNDPNDRIICTSSPVRVSTYTNILSATLVSRMPLATLTSITAATKYRSHIVNPDIAQVILPIATYDDIQVGSSVSEELRLTSPNSDRFEWLVGGYVEHTGFAEGDDGRTPTFIAGPAAALIPLAPGFALAQDGDRGFQNSKMRSTGFAVFGQGTLHLDEHIALTVGLRGQEESKHASIENFNIISPSTPFGVNVLTTTLTPTSANGVFSHKTEILSWNTTAAYQADGASMIYLTASRGGKAFGYNLGVGSAPPSARPFKNEYVINYELGAKAMVLQGRAKISLAAFDAEYRNFQNAGFVGLQFIVNNAQRVTVSGVEAAGDIAASRDVTIDAGLAYVKAKYDEYTGGSCYFGEAPDNGAGGCVRSGRDLPLTPDWRLNLGGTYRHPLPVGTLHVRIDWAWRSRSLANTNLDPRSLQKAYSLVNVRTGVRTANGWDVSLWVRNLFDQAYSMQDGVTNLNGVSDPSFQRFLGPSREFGLTLRREFAMD